MVLRFWRRRAWHSSCSWCRTLSSSRRRAASGTRLKNQVVVLVDDSADVRSSLAEVLRAEGFTVIEAGDGREGVERTRAAMPDLVLMDLSLPVLDGAAAMRIIKSFVPTNGIPVVALTGLSLSPADLRALGFDASLRKPCSPHALLECVAAVVSTGRRARR